MITDLEKNKRARREQARSRKLVELMVSAYGTSHVVRVEVGNGIVREYRGQIPLGAFAGTHRLGRVVR